MTREPGTDAAATDTNAPSQPLTSQPKQAQYASTFVPGVKRETAVSTACPPSSSQPSAAPLRRNNSIDASPPPRVRLVSRNTTQTSRLINAQCSHSSQSSVRADCSVRGSHAEDAEVPR
jgi:hypothetical protein